MDLDKTIKGRRSILKFKKKDISWEKINEILESFIYAPVAGNIQTWRLIVLKNKGQLDKACLGQEPVTSSDFLVVVCSDNEDLKKYYKTKAEKFAIQSTSAGIQNMMLKAYSMKIGSCWIGSFNENDVKTGLKIPENIDVHAIIAFGIPNSYYPMPTRTPLRSIINFSEYGNKKRDIFPIIKK